MKKLLHILFFLLLVTQICSAQWFWQNPLPTGNTLSSVQFVSSEVGWAVGGALIGLIIGLDNGHTYEYEFENDEQARKQ